MQVEFCEFEASLVYRARSLEIRHTAYGRRQGEDGCVQAKERVFGINQPCQHLDIRVSASKNFTLTNLLSGWTNAISKEIEPIGHCDQELIHLARFHMFISPGLLNLSITGHGSPHI